jgi:hypothetical protein
MAEIYRAGVPAAIAAARAGERQTAKQILNAIVAEEPSNAEAWLWLSGVVDDPAEQRLALERVVALEPDHTRANRGLQWLREHHPEVFMLAPPPASFADPPPAPATADTLPRERLVVGSPEVTNHAAGYPAPPALADESTQQIGAQEAQPGVAAPAANAQVSAADGEGDAPRSSLSEEFRCPHCGEWAAAGDMSCPRCHGSLIVDVNRTVGARLSRLTLVLLWALAAAAAIAGAAWLFVEAPRLQAGTSALLPFLRPLGLAAGPNAPLPFASSAGLTLGAFAVIALLVALGLAARRRAVYVMQIVLLVAAFAGGIALAALTYPALAPALQVDMVAGAIGTAIVAGAVLLPLLQLWLTYASRREFYPLRARVQLPAQTLAGAEHFRRGTRFRDRGWRWAAARELELAVEREPQALKYRRALADVYASMGNHVRARDELRASLNLQPDTGPAGRARVLAEDAQRGRE